MPSDLYMHNKPALDTAPSFSFVSMVIARMLCPQCQTACDTHYEWHRLPRPEPFSLPWKPFSLQIIWCPKDNRIKSKRVLKQKWLGANSPPKIKQANILVVKCFRWRSSVWPMQKPRMGTAGLIMVPKDMPPWPVCRKGGLCRWD